MSTIALADYEYDIYFEPYLNLVLDVPLEVALKTSYNQVWHTLRQLSEQQFSYKYAENKWTIKELLVHLMDTERIFCSRALRFARKDKTNLPPFDENHFAQNAPCLHRSKKSLLKEYKILRKNTLCMFSGFTEEALLHQGKFKIEFFQ